MATHKKRGVPCPNCKVDYWKRTVDFDTEGKLVPYWECPNCSYTVAKQVHKRGTGITPSQRKALDYAKNYLFEHNSHGENYELVDVKEEFTEHGDVLLSGGVQYKVEGTIGNLFPTRFFLSVGRNGGYTCFAHHDNEKCHIKKDQKVTGNRALIFCTWN